MNTLTGTLVPAAEAASTPEALALLRVFAAVGSPALRAAAGQAAERLHARDVTDPPWAGPIGAPSVGDCWHYADVGGRQESLTMTFCYAARQHAVSVLIDHGRGGKIRDTWVTKGAGLRADTEREAARDPLVIFEVLDASAARLRLERAISAASVPSSPIRSTRGGAPRPAARPPRPARRPGLTSVLRVSSRNARFSSSRRCSATAASASGTASSWSRASGRSRWRRSSAGRSAR